MLDLWVRLPIFTAESVMRRATGSRTGTSISSLLSTGNRPKSGREVRTYQHRSIIEGVSRSITCYLRYVIDPRKLSEFEEYARLWIPIVNRMGGTHHGYCLPSEGANNIALALFSFPSFAAYEDYRIRMATDPECIAAYELDTRNRSIVSYERSFMRPLPA
jgi:hypothetical protein